MKFNILHLTPDFNYVDGRSYYVFLLLKYLSANEHRVYLCTNNGDSFDRVEQFGIKVFRNTSLSTKTAFVKSLNYISKIISDYDINVIHSHHRYYELLGNTSAKNKKVHTVFTALSLVDKRYFIEYRSDKIIAVSECVRRMLIDKFKINKNKIELIPNFVDSAAAGNFEPDSKSNDPETGINILSVGRFHKEKNFETLLNAISEIKDFKITLDLIGEGAEKNLYSEIIRKKSLNVRILPPQKNLGLFFEKADICVLPSIKDPLPGFMLQSGLFRKPFIGSDTDGIKEVIKDRTNGLLFEKKNVNHLVEKIKLFAKEKAFAQQCAASLHQLVRKNYTERTVIPQIGKLYSGLFA